MNDLRKKLSLLSVPALFLLSALLLACGNTVEPSASTDSESEKPVSDTAPAEETISPAQQYLDSLSDVDFGGATISILSMDEVSASGLTSLSAEEENGDILNDTVYQRNRAAEERCNMTIACTEVQNVSAMTKKLVTAGSGEYDLTFNQVKQTLANASHGYYLNFCEIPSIDLSRPWWDSEAAKLLTLNGKLFAAFSDMNIHGFTVNIDIPELRETLTLLRYAGNNLNQLAKWAHENNSIYETEIEELRSQHSQMLSAMDSILTCLRKYQ